MSKAYTKSHFIREIAKANGLSREKSTETVNTLLEIIKRTLESGEDVLSPNERSIEMDEFLVRCPACEKTGCRRLLIHHRVYLSFITA